MPIHDLANDFASLLNAGKAEEAAEKYNADDIVSIEAMGQPDDIKKGKAAVKRKGEWWMNAHEIHSASTEGPYVNGDQFALRFQFEVTVKESGQRLKMDEVGLYTVKSGKIVEERFLYGPMG